MKFKKSFYSYSGHTVKREGNLRDFPPYLKWCWCYCSGDVIAVLVAGGAVRFCSRSRFPGGSYFILSNEALQLTPPLLFKAGRLVCRRSQTWVDSTEFVVGLGLGLWLGPDGTVAELV